MGGKDKLLRRDPGQRDRTSAYCISSVSCRVLYLFDNSECPPYLGWEYSLWAGSIISYPVIGIHKIDGAKKKKQYVFERSYKFTGSDSW